MQVTRFESLSRKLAEDFAAATPESQHAAVVAAVDFAMKQSQMRDRSVLAAFDKFKADQPLTASDLASLEAIRQAFDDENDRRLDEAKTNHRDPVGDGYVDAPFLSARATAALQYAASGKGDESIYEAAATADNEDEQQVIDLVQATLKNSRPV